MDHQVSSFTQTASFPFTTRCHLPGSRLHEVRTLKHRISLIPSNLELVWSLVFSPHIFRQQTGFLMGKEHPLDRLCPFLAEIPPIQSRGVRNYKSLVISTQKGQSLTKGSLSLLSWTRRQPPSEIKRANPFRLRNEGPLVAKTPPFRGDPCITHARSMWGWNTVFWDGHVPVDPILSLVLGGAMLAADTGLEWNNDYACFREFYEVWDHSGCAGLSSHSLLSITGDLGKAMILSIPGSLSPVPRGEVPSPALLCPCPQCAGLHSRKDLPHVFLQ